MSADVAGEQPWRQGRRYAAEVPADRTVLADLEQRLAGLNLIDTPVWVYDTERCQALWANAAGLGFWQADTLDDLRRRDVRATQSEAIYALANDHLRRVLAGERISEWVTFDARGTSRRFNHSYHALTLADGRAVLLIEAKAGPSAEEMLDFASDHTLTVGLYEIDGQLISGNPAFRTLTAHHPLQELTALLPDDGSRDAWQTTIATQSELVFDTELQTDRGPAQFRGRLRQVLGQSGQPRAILTLANLTEQRVRDTERALSETRARAEHFLDRAEVATYVTNLERRRIQPDRRWWSMLGYADDEFPVTYETWQSLLHPDDVAGLRAGIAAVSAQRAVQWNHAYRLRCKDGSWRWVLDRGVVTRRDVDGRPLEFSGICLDIHEQKRVEEALARSEMRQSALLGALPDLIIVQDQHGCVVDLHAANPELWWMPREKVFGRRLAEHLPPQVEAAFNEAQALVLTTGRMVHNSYSIDHPERGTCYREFRMVPYGAGQTLTLIRDVTAQQLAERQRQQAVRQMQQAQKMEALGQLTGGIAHDFNNILASILGYAWLARQHPLLAADPKASEYLKIVTAAGERGRDLVQKLLTFSRRSHVAALEAIDPLPVIEEAFRMLQSIVPSRITMSLRLPPEAPAIAADPGELQQVLVNLVVNSRDALGEHGAITIALAPAVVDRRACTSCLRFADGHYLALSVSDTGVGIPADALGRIFDPFFTTKGVGEGTGIGLSVVDGIVHRSGGHLVVESEPGRGTRFEILLPLASRLATRAPTAPVTAPTRSAGRGKLMVVDDEAWLGAFLQELLQEFGFTVEVFGNGADALTALNSAPDSYTAVITDLTMPHMSGLELASAIRLRQPGLPIVLCTGAGRAPDPDTAARAGIRHVLPKPIPVAELQALLADLVTS